MNKPNPELYREMSKPFASLKEANAAIEAFHADLEAARTKHRMKDLVMIVEVAFTAQDGDELATIAIGSFGDTSRREMLLAYACGQERKASEERIARLLAGKGHT